MEGLKVNEKFYLFKLGGVDLILGVTWLASLGEVKINWRNLTKSFDHREEEIMIKGDLTLTKKVVPLEALLKKQKLKLYL
ncbi:hypothetical protein LR48_Vigan03g089700 [Vigna angularis]|uniref:Uncharacterized protein n=2 Tax=Phaseolus angularis TaxID=3914 RepID=A0A0L9U409_PHAAN|nr:hypothetical protein LR48_Vigan03g089700 [Vigna angularis]BAT84087.1 hypothetical protein VIGAN_04135900 [Vigna angularis var. angularis]